MLVARDSGEAKSDQKLRGRQHDESLLLASEVEPVEDFVESELPGLGGYLVRDGLVDLALGALLSRPSFIQCLIVLLLW